MAAVRIAAAVVIAWFAASILLAFLYYQSKRAYQRRHTPENVRVPARVLGARRGRRLRASG